MRIMERAIENPSHSKCLGKVMIAIMTILKAITDAVTLSDGIVVRQRREGV